MLALVNHPSPHLQAGERTFIGSNRIDEDIAQQQHAAYRDRLREAGVEVRELCVSQEHPDSVFIEDVAIVLDEIAVLASMGVRSRIPEPAGVEQVLRQLREVHRIGSPATIEGGDVLRVGRSLLVGVSARTNRGGVEAFAEVVERCGYSVQPIPVTGCLHLKTACCPLPDGRLLVNPDWLDARKLRGFEQIRIPHREPWAANILSIGQRVLMPAEQVETAELIEALGFEIATVDLSEFAKAEGGITCLSLILRS